MMNDVKRTLISFLSIFYLFFRVLYKIINQKKKSIPSILKNPMLCSYSTHTNRVSNSKNGSLITSDIQNYTYKRQAK